MMPVVTAENAPTFAVEGSVITGLASPSRGSHSTAAWRVQLEPNHPSPEHSLTREEIFVVLSGSVTARYADRDETAAAGGALIVPPGERFSLIAVDTAAEAVCMMPVGGMAVTDGAAFAPPWAR